ncbi:hypothetical protein [Limnospira platensis]|uniref:hypothetical protein n=1 Tax=Limnospira platensis TaxID=118562 RepID=UPI00054E322D|nr:hypothetical protein [Arthrospira platensis NCB002]
MIPTANFRSPAPSAYWWGVSPVGDDSHSEPTEPAPSAYWWGVSPVGDDSHSEPTEPAPSAYW